MHSLRSWLADHRNGTAAAAGQRRARRACWTAAGSILMPPALCPAFRSITCSLGAPCGPGRPGVGRSVALGVCTAARSVIEMPWREGDKVEVRRRCDSACALRAGWVLPFGVPPPSGRHPHGASRARVGRPRLRRRQALALSAAARPPLPPAPPLPTAHARRCALVCTTPLPAPAGQGRPVGRGLCGLLVDGGGGGTTQAQGQGQGPAGGGGGGRRGHCGV